MNVKVGRNDPCPCGSGKKYKNCCISKSIPATRRKLTAKWINQPHQEEPKQQPVNLMERTFGNAIASTYEPSGQIAETELSQESGQEPKQE